jgi:nucleotide-binding universal stress UspA family protein
MDTYTGPRVIVGVDDSAPGLAALRVAVGEARRRGLPLHAARAQTDLVLCDHTEIDLAFAEAFGACPEDVEVHKELLVGPAAKALSRRANHPGDLLVVGTTGRGWWHRFWAGSVSRGCLRSAHCQVLIVPGPETARTARRSRRATWRGLENHGRTTRG